MKVLCLNNVFIFGYLLSTTSLIGQWCNPSINGGTIVPTTTSQTTPTVSANRYYYTFVAEAGCEYTFSTCGLSSTDTRLRLYNSTGSTLILDNDDFCGSRSQLTVLFNTGGTYTIHLSRNNCRNINSNTSISYIKNCLFDNRECFGAEQICDDTPFSSNVSNYGPHQNIDDSNRGCLADGEHQSYWYYFRPIMDGTIDMTISTCGSCDYDFAIWQTGDCGNLGSPIRCSYDENLGDTGLSPSALDVSEGSTGNATPKFVNTLTVNEGQQYIMLIDNYSANNEPFDIEFSFSDPGLLDCIPFPLPIQLADFTAEQNDKTIDIEWQTASEINNDYFFLEKSLKGKNWELINQQKGLGFSNKKVNYSFTDQQPQPGFNYYRLKQTDFDGQLTYSHIVSVKYFGSYDFQISPNPLLNDELFVHFETEQTDSFVLKIINTFGNTVHEEFVAQDSNKIKMSNKLARGIYLVEISINGQLLRQKLVVN